MQETWVPSLGGEDPLEKGTLTHTSILTGGKSQGQRHLVGHSPWGHRRATHNWATKHLLKLSVSAPVLVCQPRSGRGVFPLRLEWLFSGEIYSWVMKSSSASYNLCDDIRKRKKWTIYFFLLSVISFSLSLCVQGAMLQYICGQAVCQACEGMSAYFSVIVKQINVCGFRHQ